jgi:predicted ArsR family transcriptional regulator
MKQRKVFTHEEVIALLCSPSPKAEAVLLYLTTVKQATTGEIAKALCWDKSNTGRRLEALAEDGFVECVDDSHHEGNRGRPARLWRVL